MSQKPASDPEFKPASIAQWAQAAAKSAHGGDVEALHWPPPDGISVVPDTHLTLPQNREGSHS